LIIRALKGLESAVPVTVVDPFMGDEGWGFRDDRGRPLGEPELDARFLRELYLVADPGYTGRVTVPVLWDRVARTIVNNESREILNMLDVVMHRFRTHDLDLYPYELRAEIDSTIDRIYAPINNGVYRCGFAQTQRAYDIAFDELFAALTQWEHVLESQRYLCGDRLTEADICMFTTLLRFDPVYYVHFKCNQRRIVDYPHLSGYLRELYSLRGVAETCRFDDIKMHYYRSQPGVNPKGLVARGPDLSYLAAPHGRDYLPARDLELLQPPLVH
jgi:putative glutathione S-transferase